MHKYCLCEQKTEIIYLERIKKGAKRRKLQKVRQNQKNLSPIFTLVNPA